MAQVWFITAASSGFGREISLEALRRGHTVIATTRNVSRMAALKDAGAHIMAFDVTWPLVDIEAAVRDVFSRFGHVDYVVNAAGYILEGAVEELSTQEIYDQFNTNVFGIMNTFKAFLPYLREQEINPELGDSRATIAAFGSLGSWRGGATYSAYSMTKWCVSSLMESLHEELSTFGITATVVEPGYFRTGLLNPGAKVEPKLRLGAYEDGNTPSGKIRAALRVTDGNQPGNAKKGSAALVDILTRTGVAEGRTVPVRIVMGSDCEQAIRDKCSHTLALLDSWGDVIRSTDYAKGE